LNYTINTGFEDGTTIKVETSNRKLFFRIEEIINNFQFQNEESNRIEPQNTFQNELDLNNGIEKTENDGNEENFGIGFEKHDGNEPQSQIQNTSEKNSGNEPAPLPTSIQTKWGNAYLHQGYYRISSMEYRGESLHKLIYEDYHKCTVIYGHIHHIDGNKTNNNPENLILLTPSEHAKITQDFRKYGNRKENPLIPRVSEKDEDYWKYSNQLSVDRNTTGYLHVYKQVCPRWSQGFTWKYTWRENGKLKTLESTNIKKLEAKVKAKGLPWQKL